MPAPRKCGAGDAPCGRGPEGGSRAVAERGGGQGGDPGGVNADTLRGWCKQARNDAGERPATTGDAKIKQLEAENRELKRANEILLAAA